MEWRVLGNRLASGTLNANDYRCPGKRKGGQGCVQMAKLRGLPVEDGMP